MSGKGQKMHYKPAGRRAVSGDNKPVGSAIRGSSISLFMKETDIKESMRQAPSKTNPFFQTDEAKALLKLNDKLVKETSYEVLRERKDEANKIRKQCKEALENIPKHVKTQDGLNKYLASVIGGNHGDALLKLLEATIGK